MSEEQHALSGQGQLDDVSFDTEPKKFYKAKVYRYSRHVDGSPLPNPVFGHWCVRIDYLDKDEDERLPDSYIYEAQKNKTGYLYAKERHFQKKDEEKKGARSEFIAEISVCKKDVVEFCEDVNDKRIPYKFWDENCQQFVNDLLMSLSLTTKYSIKKMINDVFHFSSESITVMVIKVYTSCLGSGEVSRVLSEVLTSFGIDNAGNLADEIVVGLKSIGLSGLFNWTQCFKILAEILLKFIGKGFFDEFKFGSNKALHGGAVLFKMISPADFSPYMALFIYCTEILFFCFEKSVAISLKKPIHELEYLDYERFFKMSYKILLEKIKEIYPSDEPIQD